MALNKWIRRAVIRFLGHKIPLGKAVMDLGTLTEHMHPCFCAGMCWNTYWCGDRAGFAGAALLAMSVRKGKSKSSLKKQYLSSKSCLACIGGWTPWQGFRFLLGEGSLQWRTSCRSDWEGWQGLQSSAAFSFSWSVWQWHLLRDILLLC